MGHVGPVVMRIYRFGPFRLDRDRLLLSVGDEPLALGPKVVETVLALVEHPGEVLGKTELLDRVWPEGFVEEANLAQNIYVIRKALRAHWDRNAIETVPRRGYRFTEPVTVETYEQTHVSEPAIKQPSEPAVMPLRRPRFRFGFAAAAIAAVILLLAGGLSLVAFAGSHNDGVAEKGLSPDGARLYAMGTFYWNQRTEESVQKSLRYFQQVVESDPRDARGYAGVALAYAIDGDYGFGPFGRRPAFARALAYAKRALAIDPQSAEAHSAMGLADIDNMQVLAGQAEFRRAITLDSRYAPAHQWYGMSLLRQGKGEEALAELRKATDLDPESVAATAWLGEAAYMARRYSDAIDYARQTIDLSPQRSDAYVTLGLAYEGAGNYKQAILAYEQYAQMCSSCKVDSAVFLAHAYAASHRYSDAERELRIARAGVARRRVNPDDLATALIALGRRGDALRILRDANRDKYNAMLAIDPRMDPVRHDARFRPYIQGPA